MQLCDTNPPCLLIWQPWDNSLPNALLVFFPRPHLSHPISTVRCFLSPSPPGSVVVSSWWGGDGSSPSLAALLLAPGPLPNNHDISFGLILMEFGIPVDYSPLSYVCLIFPVFSLGVSGEVRALAVMVLSTSQAGDPITQSRRVSLILCVNAPSTVLLSACLSQHLTPRWSSSSAKLGWAMAMMLCQAIPSKCIWQHLKKKVTERDE